MGRSEIAVLLVAGLGVACGADDVGVGEGSTTAGSGMLTTSTASPTSTASTGSTASSGSTEHTTASLESSSGEGIDTGDTTTVDLGLHDTECPPLTLEGDLGIYSIEDVFELPQYTNIVGSVAITNTEGLTGLESLSCLQEVGGDLIIAWNHDLESVAGLSRLAAIGGYLSVHHNDALISLEELGARSIGGYGVHVYHNPSLEVLGLRELEVAPNVFVGSAFPGCYPDGNPAMVEVNGLDSLAAFDKLVFTGNQGLVSLDGLIGLAERTGPPVPDVADLEVAFLVNESLSIDYIHEIWDQYMVNGPVLAQTCSNLGEVEQCECP